MRKLSGRLGRSVIKIVTQGSSPRSENVPLGTQAVLYMQWKVVNVMNSAATWQVRHCFSLLTFTASSIHKRTSESVKIKMYYFCIFSDVDFYFCKDGPSSDPPPDVPSPQLTCWPHNPVRWLFAFIFCMKSAWKVQFSKKDFSVNLFLYKQNLLRLVPQLLV